MSPDGEGSEKFVTGTGSADAAARFRPSSRPRLAGSTPWRLRVRSAEHRPRPRRVGRRIVLERRDRASPGRRLHGDGTAVRPRPIADDVAKLRLGAGAPERADRRGGALVRRADHHVAGRRRAERRGARLRRSVRAGRGRVDRRAARRRGRRHPPWRTSMWTSAAPRGCRRRTSSGTSPPTWIAPRRG